MRDRRSDKQERAAELTIESEYRSSAFFLVLYNRGPHQANDVQCEVTYTEDDVTREPLALIEHPIHLDAGQSWPIYSDENLAALDVRARLRWTDGRGAIMKDVIVHTEFPEIFH